MYFDAGCFRQTAAAAVVAQTSEYFRAAVYERADGGREKRTARYGNNGNARGVALWRSVVYKEIVCVCVILARIILLGALARDGSRFSSFCGVRGPRAL